jgi:hypothetical protein
MIEVFLELYSLKVLMIKEAGQLLQLLHPLKLMIEVLQEL